MKTLKLGHTSRLIVQKSTFKGEERIDIRKQYLGDDGEFHFTKKGLSLTKEQVEWLKDTLQEL